MSSKEMGSMTTVQWRIFSVFLDKDGECVYNFHIRKIIWYFCLQEILFLYMKIFWLKKICGFHFNLKFTIVIEEKIIWIMQFLTEKKLYEEYEITQTQRAGKVI